MIIYLKTAKMLGVALCDEAGRKAGCRKIGSRSLARTIWIYC
jgi:hypothetical protein